MRRRAAKKRILAPDPTYNDVLVTRFVNNMMWDGKKSLAFKIFYDCLERVESTAKEKGYELAIHTGNCIFVKREYAEVLDIDKDNFDELFDRSWIGTFGESMISKLKRKFRGLKVKKV